MGTRDGEDQVSDESGFEPLPPFDDIQREVLEVIDTTFEVIDSDGDEHDLIARLVTGHGEAEALRMLSLVQVSRARVDRDRMSTDPLTVRRQIVALVTENIHRRLLDRSDPIIGDPLSDPVAAREYLARIDTESKLIAEAVESPDGPEDFVGELVAFAATAVEIWALESEHDPLTLLERIALQWESDPSATP